MKYLMLIVISFILSLVIYINPLKAINNDKDTTFSDRWRIEKGKMATDIPLKFRSIYIVRHVDRKLFAYSGESPIVNGLKLTQKEKEDIIQAAIDGLINSFVKPDVSIKKFNDKNTAKSISLKYNVNGVELYSLSLFGIIKGKLVTAFVISTKSHEWNDPDLKLLINKSNFSNNSEIYSVEKNQTP